MTMLDGVLETLAREAEEWVKTQPREMAGNLFEKKFAELIIEECLDVVIESDPSPKMIINEPYRSIVENIKEHFGVE